MSDQPIRNRPSRPATVLLAFVVLGLSAATRPAQAEGRFRVIVNAERATDVIRKNQLSALFLKGQGQWKESGVAVVPVDQSLASAVRAAFSREVLEMEPREVMTYWNRRVLKREAWPPKVMGTDAEVVDFVAAQVGGIGYVSDSIELPSTVKAVEVLP